MKPVAPTVTIQTEGVSLNSGNCYWQTKDGEIWKQFSGSRFVPGEYRFHMSFMADSSEYAVTDPVKVTVDGDEQLSRPSLEDGKYNISKIYSNEYTVKETYSVLFEANGGTGMQEDIHTEVGKKTLMPECTFEKEGYDCSGWKYGSKTYKTGAEVAFPKAKAGDVITMTAQWTADKTYPRYNYTIVFNGNGSTGGTMKNLAAIVGTAKALTKNAYKKDGYHFEGWAVSADGPVVYNDKAKVTDLSITYQSTSIELFAVWEKNTYTVTLNGNGGSYSEGKKTVKSYTDLLTYDEAEILPANKFTRGGYSFLGWAKTAKATVPDYLEGQEYTFNLVAANNGKAKLYAVWQANPYTIHFDPGDGGTGEMADIETEYAKTVKLPAVTYVKEGWRFNGWKCDEDEKTYKDKASVKNLATEAGGAVTLTAQWLANTATFKFNMNGGKAPDKTTYKNIKITTGDTLDLTGKSEPVFAGYTFLGWSTRADADESRGAVNYENPLHIDPVVVEKNGSTVTLYARWKKKDPARIGIILIGDEDETYSDAHIKGVLQAMENCDLTDDDVVWSYNIPENDECYDKCKLYAEQGCAAVFTNSYGHQVYAERAASEYPDVQFVTINGDTARRSELLNFSNAYNKLFESRYVSGVVAGMKVAELVSNDSIPETGYDGDENVKIGYVGTFPYAEVVSGYTAFFLGIRSVVPNVAMEVMYTNSWFDPEAEGDAAEQLINDGCVIIGQHSESTSAPAAVQAARIAGKTVYCVGHKTDMLDVAPSAALTSSAEDWSVYYTYAFSQMLTGKKIATDWAEGYSSDAVGITALGQGCADGTAAKVAEVVAAFKAGTLHVFDINTFTVGGQKVVSAYTYDSDGDWINDTNEGIVDGYYHECEYISAPSFSLRIDGITELYGS